MKIRSLLLGSAAAAGLATGAFAADPVTLTSLNMCDSLGKTGLTVSSDTDCLQISGEVKYEFNWGDYKGTFGVAQVANPGGAGTLFTVIDNDADGARMMDWDSRLEWNIKVVATADTDGGPVSATVKIKEVQQYTTRNNNNFGPNGVANPAVIDQRQIYGADGVAGGTLLNADYVVGVGANGVLNTPLNNPATATGGPNPLGDDVAVDDYAATGGDHTNGLIADEAYITIGEGTVIMIGKKGSIINKGDDEPFNTVGGSQGLFNSEKVDKGVYWSQPTGAAIGDGGHVIQIASDLGNGLSASVGAENLQATGAMAGTLVGVLAYAGDGITAHVTAVAGGFLDGTIERFAVHAGFTGTFDTVQIRAAIATDNSGYFNGMASAMATFDMFKLAASVEAASGGDWGVGASLTATVADGVDINIGGRYYNDGGAGPSGYQIAAQVAAMVTETIQLKAEAGVYGNITAGTTDPYVSAGVYYTPGGGAAVSVKGEFHGDGAIKGTVAGNKTF